MSIVDEARQRAEVCRKSDMPITRDVLLKCANELDAKDAEIARLTKELEDARKSLELGLAYGLAFEQLSKDVQALSDKLTGSECSDGCGRSDYPGGCTCDRRLRRDIGQRLLAILEGDEHAPEVA